MWMYPCNWNTEEADMGKGVFSVFLWCKWIVLTPGNLVGGFTPSQVPANTATSNIVSSSTNADILAEHDTSEPAISNKSLELRDVNTEILTAGGSSLSPPRIFVLPTLIIHILSSIPRVIGTTVTNLQNATTVVLDRLPSSSATGRTCRNCANSKGSALVIPWGFGIEVKMAALAVLGLAGVFAVCM